MTDEERMALLAEAEALLNKLFNGDPASDSPAKRVIWGLVALDDPESIDVASEVMLAANTQDMTLLAALFISAGGRLHTTWLNENGGPKLDG